MEAAQAPATSGCVPIPAMQPSVTTAMEAAQIPATSVHVPATEPNNGNSTVPASKISTTEMMDVDKEPETTEVVNDNRHDDESPSANGNSTVPASKISTTEMMDVDKEPVTTEVVNDNRHDDESPSANTSPQRSVTPISPITVPVDDDDGPETEAAKKRDLPGNESIGPPSPRMLQAYIQESKDYLSGVSDLQIWKDLVNIWVQFEKNCSQRGVSRFFSLIL
jgi:hypothetical protein